MKWLGSILLILGLGVSAGEETINLAEFTSETLTESGRKLGKEESFNQHPVQGLWLPEDFSLLSSEGESGTGALFLNRTDPAKYTVATLRLNLKPEYKYRAAVRCKAENLKNHKRGSRILCIEFQNGKKYAGGSYYYKQITDNGQWFEAVLEFSPPARFDTAHAGFFLPRGATGKVWWDNFSIEVLGMLPAQIYSVQPSNLTIRDNRGLVVLKSYLFQPGLRYSDLAMSVTVNGKSRIWKSSDGLFSGELGELPDGKILLNAKLLNLKKRTILAEKALTLFVNKRPPGKFSSFIDRHGRAIVDGKPFMPLGMFSLVMDEPMAANLKQAGFNCVMPYRACWDIDNSFRIARKYGLKMMFNVMYQRPKSKHSAYPRMKYKNAEGIDNVLKAWIEDVRFNPMLLGYYLSDEHPVEEIPDIRKMRETVNAADPDHFTMTLTYVPRHFPFFAETGDVLGVDNYPIENESSRGMSSLSNLVADGVATGLAVWAVPQAFNWGVHHAMAAKKPEEYHKYRFPTREEMRSMCLAGAVNGAKGFLLYSYSGIFTHGEKFAPGSSSVHWPDVVAAVKALKELEPFILSLEKPPELIVGTMRNAQARVWRSRGRVAAALIGNGPGECVAEFTIPGQPDLESRYGNTKNLGGGKYRFQGKNISSDVLFSR